MDVPSLVIGTIATTASIAITRCGCCSATSPRRPAVDRLALEPLSAAAVGQLAVGYEVDPADLYARTGGNPFFVAQVLAAGEAGVPPTVRDAVLGRASALSEQALEVIETVALALPRAEPWLLEAVLHDGTRHIDECLASGLVATDDDVVAFRHEIARTAVEDAMPPTRRLGLQRRILAALTGTAPARSTRLGSRTTPRRPATPPRDSSSPLRPLTGRIRPAPTVRRPRSTRAPSGSAVRRSQPADAASCSKDARGPATWRTTSSRRSRSSERRSRAGARRAQRLARPEI